MDMRKDTNEVEAISLLTEERHQLIMELLHTKGTVRIQELVEKLDASESTVRRDLSFLEKRNKLKRVHGGAALLKRKREELSMTEKSLRNLPEKRKIGAYAASLVEEGDCIFLDAGTTTYQMIDHLSAKDITVVTTGITHLEPLLNKGIATYIIGGFVRGVTKAVIGQTAIQALSKFRFDKTFLGVNGVHYEYGFTTPNPEEAAVKSAALKLAQSVYVLADDSKFHEVTFSEIAPLKEAEIITTLTDQEVLEKFQTKTTIKVVSG